MKRSTIRKIRRKVFARHAKRIHRLNRRTRIRI